MAWTAPAWADAERDHSPRAPSSGGATTQPAASSWSGSQLLVLTSAGPNVLLKDLEQTAHPIVESSFFAQPRFALGPVFQLRGRLVADYEWTQSDPVTPKNGARLEDGTASLYAHLPDLLGFSPALAGQVTFPFSAESRFRTMVFAPGALVQLTRTFEHVLGGDVLLVGNVLYQHPVYRFTTAGLRNPAPYSFHCVGGSAGCAEEGGGASNTSDSIAWSLLVSGDFGRFSPGIFFRMSHRFLYQLSPYEGEQAPIDAAKLRQVTYFSFWLDYNANDWLAPEIGYFMERNVLDADGTYGNAFFARHQDMRVYAGLNVALDKLYLSLRGRATEAGVERAQARPAHLIE